MIRFRVNGTPAPQGSKRHVGNGRMVEMSKAVGPWREAVRAEAVAAWKAAAAEAEAAALDGYISGLETLMRIRDGAVSVTLVFVMARPKAHYGTGRNSGTVKDSAPRFPAGRPDIDKLARAVLDGLVMGGVMADDGQVASLSCCKVYARNGEAPGALIEVEAMEGSGNG